MIRSEELQREILQGESLRKEMKKGLLQWYDFKPNAVVLYIDAESSAGRESVPDSPEDSAALLGNPAAPTAGIPAEDTPDALRELLMERPLQLSCASLEQTCDEGWSRAHQAEFDYIICVETLERHSDPRQVLYVWRGLLNPQGRLLLGMNNRFGIRYFCGDRDKYTERNFDGIENYRRAYSKKEDTFQGCCYSRSEVKQMLRNAGWEKMQFYSVLSDLQNPSLIYAEDFLPNEDLATRVFPIYNYPNTVFLEEEALYDSLVQNGMFHQMANAYLIECALDEKAAKSTGELPTPLSDILHVTSSMGRGREDGLLTILRRTGRAEKRAACPEGRERLEKLARNIEDLKAHGVKVVEGRLENGVYTMPYVQGEAAQLYLKRLLYTDREKFLQQMDHFRDLILQSSEIIKPDSGDGNGAVLRRGYWDMVPLNSFYTGEDFVFYDQEFCMENYPANAVITRMIATFYAGNMEFEKLLPASVLYDRYGLTAQLPEWHRMEWEFLERLRKEKELRVYHQAFRRNAEVVNSNRQRMNYSDNDYQKLFIDIFRNADTRKLILFGSGTFTKRFLALYRQDYPVYAIIDNNVEKWGREMEGIPIQSPELLHRLQPGEYKVLICIKNYLSVMKQLDAMGVAEYSIFDSNKDYPRKRKPIVPDAAGEKGAPKKYHTGYIAGVFDLFHVGHLNMFKRAKEQCDYLIVGVVSDEGVRKFKEVEPFVPFEERIEMVRSCRYVDEAVEIPLNYGGTRDAYRLHHFDCQFSGSDYVDNPDWLAEKEFLERHGAEMVFFPYTQSTSSTRIKSLIDKKLL